LIHSDGFELFFNRDESVRRGPAEGPRVLELGSLAALAPRDGDAGGAWIGVNTHGLALGLLNGRETLPPPRQPTSRGLLLLELLTASGCAEVWTQLARLDLACYRPFELLTLVPGASPVVARWDGARLERIAARLPLCSSSLDGGRAQSERERVFAHLVPGPPGRATLTRFHASHEPERGPWSPCMHRTEARTVSATEVRVGAGRIAMRYADGAPCTTSFGPWLELERRA
jgi:hypothetical protein